MTTSAGGEKERQRRLASKPGSRPEDTPEARAAQAVLDLIARTDEAGESDVLMEIVNDIRSLHTGKAAETAGRERVSLSGTPGTGGNEAAPPAVTVRGKTVELSERDIEVIRKFADVDEEASDAEAIKEAIVGMRALLNFGGR